MIIDNWHQQGNVEVMLADLKACSRTRNLERGKQIHLEAIECGHGSRLNIENALISMYAKCGCMIRAREVFDNLKQPTVRSWNALILGYVENGQGHNALELFARMRSEGRTVDSATLVAAIKICTSLALGKGSSESMKYRDCGKILHSIVVENGCNSDIYVQSTLVDMYAKCGSMVYSRLIFDSIRIPNVVSWTALISGYADHGQGHTALELFTSMESEPDSVTFVAALKACASIKDEASGWPDGRDRGKAMHTLAAEYGCSSGVYVQSTLVDMYCKCRSMVDACKVFDSMKHRNVVSWTSLILGYADNGQGRTSLELFTRMRNEGPAPNSITFTAALKACGLVGALEYGRTIHSEIDSRMDVILVTCVVDFYAKCGSLVEAKSFFDLHAEGRDLISWNALLAGYSSCGDNEPVFELFEEMQDAGYRPDETTFLCILTCCSHVGLVEKGKNCFHAMTTKYGISPTVKHYTCMIDLFGRANKLDDAMALLKSMTCNPNNVTWTTILDACRKWKNLDLGRRALQLINFNDSCDLTTQRGQFQEQTALAKTEEACWTNEVGEVHVFSVEDSSHPQIDDIRKKWDSIAKQHSLSLNLQSVGGDIADTVETEDALCGHSERLAVICGLINTEAGRTIRIVKNLRVCRACHFVIGLMCKLEHRTIICGDESRIHVFNCGRCSCGDYW